MFVLYALKWFSLHSFHAWVILDVPPLLQDSCTGRAGQAATLTGDVRRSVTPPELH